MSAPSAAQPARLQEVDSLRGVAAVLVVFAHTTEVFIPLAHGDPAWLGFLKDYDHHLQLARGAIPIFFALSGFVVYGSLSSSAPGVGRRFLVRRFWRLYPIFWVSLAAGLLAWHDLSDPGVPAMVAGNFLMLPTLFGQDYAMGHYWTLEVELVFYVLAFVLFAGGWLTRFRILVAAAAFLYVAGMVLVQLDGTHLRPEFMSEMWWKMPRHLATMFWGASLRWMHDHTGSFSRLGSSSRETGWFVTLTALMLIAPTFEVGRWLLNAGNRPPPSLLATALALPITVVWVCFWKPAPRWLVWLGMISCSVYLFHAVILPILARAAAPGGPCSSWPLWAYLLVMLAGSTAVGALTFYGVERPCIRLGQTLTKPAEAVRTPAPGTSIAR